MTMTAEQLAQLREVAERADSDDWGYDRDEFYDVLTPEMTLALLDELEASDALNKHLELAIRKAEGCSEALRRKTEAAEKRIAELEEQLRREQDYHLSVDMERMELWKKLEARTVTVKLPPVSFFDFNECSGFANGAYVNLEDMNKALAAAGINLTVEG